MDDRRGVFTNNERVGEALPLRRFVLIAEHEGFVWVRAVNGNYAGSYLTFARADLVEVTP